MDAVRSSLDPFVTSDGVTLYRRVYEPAGVPIGDLLLGHGIGENVGRYVQAARAFAEAGWRTVAWDLRGHGRSGGPRTYVATWSRFHDDLAEQVTALRHPGRPLVVVAHSMGGLIAFGAAATGRITPDRLVLSAPALNADIARWKQLAAPLLSRLLPMLRIPTGIGADTNPSETLSNEDLEAPATINDATARLGGEAFRAQLEARRIVARGGNFPVPTLVIHGTGDRLVRPEWCQPLGTLGNVEYVPLEGFNHHPFAATGYREAVDRILRFIGRRDAA
jgi:alpha-beta hydrolase superfamily lysophospholipase